VGRGGRDDEAENGRCSCCLGNVGDRARDGISRPRSLPVTYPAPKEKNIKSPWHLKLNIKVLPPSSHVIVCSLLPVGVPPGHQCCKISEGFYLRVCVGVRVCLSQHGVWLVPRHLEILFARASPTSTGRQRRDLQAKRCYVHPVSTPALDRKKKMSRIFSLVRCTKIRPKWSHKELDECLPSPHKILSKFCANNLWGCRASTP